MNAIFSVMESFYFASMFMKNKLMYYMFLAPPPAVDLF